MKSFLYAWTVFPLSLSGILVIEIFHSEPSNTDGPKREPLGNPSVILKSNMHNPIPIKHTHVIPTNIDHMPAIMITNRFFIKKNLTKISDNA